MDVSDNTISRVTYTFWTGIFIPSKHTEGKIFMPSLLQNETRALWTICKDLKKHRSEKNRGEVRRDIEDLEAMVMHSDNEAIRNRARAAIVATDLSVAESNVLPFHIC